MLAARQKVQEAYDRGIRDALAHALDGAPRPRNPFHPYNRPGIWWRKGADQARAMITRLVELGP